MGRLQRFEEEVSRLSASAESPDGTVTVTVGGTGEIEIRLRPGALREVTEERLAAKITRAVSDAMWEMRLQYRQANEQILRAR
jgi:DNA-binding protein YbaB